MILTKTEFEELGDLFHTLEGIVEKIGKYKPYIEDPSPMLKEIGEELDHANLVHDRLVRLAKAAGEERK